MLLRRKDEDDDYDNEDDEDEDDDEEADGEAEGGLGSESSRTQMQIDGWLTLEAPTAAVGPLLCLRHRLSACFAAKVSAFLTGQTCA